MSDQCMCEQPGVPCPKHPETYVPVPIAPDPERDARVAKRRAEDARKAGLELDRRLANPRTLMGVSYNLGWDDGYAASQEHHNRHYGVSCRVCGAPDVPAGQPCPYHEVAE